MTTQTIAQLAGPYLLATGLGMLLSWKFYAQMIENTPNSDRVLLNLSGATHFLVGLAILTNHFLWNTPPQIIITLLGIAATLKGAFLIILPTLTLQSAKFARPKLTIIGTTFIILGLYLCTIAYL